MLHKSFKPAKCKTSLKLAASRIKLLKNKKEVQIKQVRREVAQLLESGQVQTARIKVEHVVREEKTMGAYELIEIYCELIAARLPIIESQKICPIDLKEAIASVVFASPRCADIPELMDVQKHFLAKYGKDFISAAVELRPDCGVNPSLVEKLSARTPDGPTKLKILTTIAEEHNIKWDPSSFGGTEMTIRDDLLKGPSTFEKASRMHEQPPGVDTGSRKAANEEDLRNFHARTSFGGQNVPQSPDRVSSPVNPPLQTQSSANTGEGSEARHGRYSGDARVNHMGGPDWNVEFTDATAAAQAAAESAERASMAARAAAELSSRRRVTAHYAPDSHGFRDEQVKRPSGFHPPGEALPRTQVNNASVGGKSRTPDEHIDSREENIVGGGTPDAGSNQRDGSDDSDDSDSLLGVTKKLHRDAYKKSSDRNNPDFRTAGGDEDALVYEQQAAGRNTETNPWSTELDNDCISDDQSVRMNSFEELNMGSSSEIHARKNSVESFVEKRRLSSLDNQKEEDGLAENPFADDDEERIFMGDKTTSEGATVFDDYGSDEDVESVFDLDKGPKSSHVSSLPHVEARQSEDSGTPSPGRITTDSFKKSVAEPGEKLPVTFDDSDGLSSENEAEPEKSRAPRESEHGSGVRKSSRSSESVQEVVSDSGSRLAFGNLMGGRRNKSGAPPPYTQTASGRDSLPNRRRDDHKFSVSDEDPDIRYDGPNWRARTNPVSHEVTVPQPKMGSRPVVYADDNEEEFELEADYWKKPSTRPVANDVAKEHSSRPSSGKSHVGSVARLSRRTKAGIASTGESGNRRDAKDSGFSLGRADAGENSAKLRDRANATDNSDGRLKWRSEVKDDDPVSEPAKAFGTKDAAGSSRPARPSLDSASRDDSLTQASHVHPKMPQDYETLLANLESLQGNRP